MDNNEEEDDFMCLVCGERYSNSTSGEQWIACIRCGNWSHYLCTKQVPNYICHNCDSGDGM